MIYIFISLFLAAIILFIIILRSKGTGENKIEKAVTTTKEKKKKPCPICGSLLESHEKVISHEYRGESSSVVHVFGCPHCYGNSAHLERICPLCKKIMLPDNYLMGMMTRGEKKIQLKIKGCVICAGK